MFAVVANGIEAIVKTQRQLTDILALYPYPKFQKCANEEEARKWLQANKRGYIKTEYVRYGDTATDGYVQVDYFIDSQNHVVCYNIDTKKVGYIRFQQTKDMKVDSRYELIKAQVSDITLDNQLIVHHIIAIRRILKILGSYLDVDIVLQDMSVFLALTKYTGSNYMIHGAQRDIANRLGAVSFTIKE